MPNSHLFYYARFESTSFQRERTYINALSIYIYIDFCVDRMVKICDCVSLFTYILDQYFMIDKFRVWVHLGMPE